MILPIKLANDYPKLSDIVEFKLPPKTEPEKFDIVLSFNSFEHFADPENFLGHEAIPKTRWHYGNCIWAVMEVALGGTYRLYDKISMGTPAVPRVCHHA